MSRRHRLLTLAYLRGSGLAFMVVGGLCLLLGLADAMAPVQ